MPLNLEGLVLKICWYDFWDRSLLQQRSVQMRPSVTFKWTSPTAELHSWFYQACNNVLAKRSTLRAQENKGRLVKAIFICKAGFF